LGPPRWPPAALTRSPCTRRPPTKHLVQEEYLSEEEFEVVFGMDKEDFQAMPPWKRINAKKAKGLF
jgi:hypothetical protein